LASKIPVTTAITARLFLGSSSTITPADSIWVRAPRTRWVRTLRLAACGLVSR
jgi:hypothetical protein